MVGVGWRLYVLVGGLLGLVSLGWFSVGCVWFWLAVACCWWVLTTLWLGLVVLV